MDMLSRVLCELLFFFITLRAADGDGWSGGRGYALVRFAGAEDMHRCLSLSHSIDGCPVTV